MKEITLTAYETIDGRQFVTKEEADKHEFKLRIKKLVSSFYFYSMPEDAIVDALVEHRDEIAQIAWKVESK